MQCANMDVCLSSLIAFAFAFVALITQYKPGSRTILNAIPLGLAKVASAKQSFFHE